MKKLMFIAVAALTFGVNAAACAWDVDTINDPSSGSSSTGFLVYFFDANTTGASISDANTALASKDTATINTFLGKGFQADDLTDDGYTSGLTGDAYGNSQVIEGYLVIFNADTVAGADYAFVMSATESATTGAIGQSANISFGDLDDTATLSNWTKISGGVPEPTSGLLLALGGAMLALRRKR